MSSFSISVSSLSSFSFFLSFGIGSFASGIGGIIAVNYGVPSVFLFTAFLMAAAVAVALYLRKIV